MKVQMSREGQMPQALEYINGSQQKIGFKNNAREIKREVEKRVYDIKIFIKK